MNESALRRYIRHLLKEEEKQDNLLTEPDEVEDADPEEEASTVAGGSIRGVSTPLGTGSTYPNSSSRSNKSRRDQTRIVGDAFGRARPVEK